MLKKAFSTVACMKESYQNIIAACVRYGMDGFEIRMDEGGVCGMQTAAELNALREAVRESGLVITNLGSSVCFKSYDAKMLEVGKKAADTATLLGVKAVRVFLGNFSQKLHQNHLAPDHAGIVRALKELCAYALGKGVEIWIETHNEYATGVVLKKLLSDVDAANLKIIWDIIHPIEDGEPPTQTWDCIGDSIAHVHIKDGYDRQDGIWHDYCYTPLGEGSLPIASILDLLTQNGVDGYISFEWESLWREELQGYTNSLDFVLKQYADYLAAYEHGKMFV